MSLFQGVNSTTLLVNAMNVAQDNHRIIANNIANADTPGYNPVRLDFQATLRNALEGRGGIRLRRTRPQHLEASHFRPSYAQLVRTSKNDLNKVDVDEEMAQLSENAGRYNVYGSLLVKQFQMTKNLLTNAR